FSCIYECECSIALKSIFVRFWPIVSSNLWMFIKGGPMVGKTQLRRIVFAVALCLCVSISAIAQQANGTITGTVKDASGAVIPGVSVTLSSVGLVGGNQVSVTDERGVYRFIRLVPSTYSLKGELPGFRPAAASNVIVNADVTVRVDLT